MFCLWLRKKFNTRIALVWLIEKWKEPQLGKSGFAGAVQMDLSKTFHTITYDLSITKLHEYVFGKNIRFSLMLPKKKKKKRNSKDKQDFYYLLV